MLAIGVWESREHLPFRLEVTNEAMMTTQATLRFMGASLDPDDLTRIVGLDPHEAHRRGEPHLGAAGRRYSDFSEGLWALRSSTSEHAPPEDHIRELLDAVSEKLDQIRQIRAVERADIFLGLFVDEEGTGSFSIPINLIERLAATKLLTLDVDLYCACP